MDTWDIFFFAVLQVKIRARKCTDPLTLKIQSKSSEWFRSHKCNVNARKAETFQWNIPFHTTFNGSFATLETTKHSPNIRRWSLSLADQKGTELTRKRRGKKGTHTSRFHSAALVVLAIIYIWAQSGGIKSSDPCKVTLWAIGYFASQYWLWRCSCWTCIWRKWIRIIFFFLFFPSRAAKEMALLWMYIDTGPMCSFSLQGYFSHPGWDEFVFKTQQAVTCRENTRVGSSWFFCFFPRVLLLFPQSLLPPPPHSSNLNHPSLRPAAVYHLAAVCGY